MPAYTIESSSDVQNIIERFLDPNDTSDMRIELGEALKSPITLHYSGGAYEETIITPRIMKGILELQGTLYRVYALQKYGNPHKLLTQEERKEAELIVKVQPGSSKIEIFTDKALEVIMSMSDNHKLKAIIAVAVIIGLGTVGTTWVKESYSLKHEEIRVELEKERVEERQNQLSAIENIAVRAIESNERAFRYFNNGNLTSATVHGKEVGVDVITEQTKVERTIIDSISVHQEGLYRVIDINFAKENTIVDLLNEETQSRLSHVILADDLLSDDDYAIIEGAKNRNPINLELSLTKKGDKIIEATVVRLIS